jgi:hypothetical protein
MENFVSYYIEGVTTLTVCCIGLVINAAAIVMLLRQKNSGSIFLKLMISLATYDLIYVFLSSICFSLPRLSTEFKSKCIFFYILATHKTAFYIKTPPIPHHLQWFNLEFLFSTTYFFKELFFTILVVYFICN